MRQHGEVAKRFLLTLLVSAGLLAVIGVIIGALSGRDVWRTVMWTFAVGGGVLIVANIAGSGSDRPLADPRSGSAFGGTIRDATTSAGWLVVGLLLAAAGAGGLVV
jgi:hypothetical protein